MEEVTALMSYRTITDNNGSVIRRRKIRQAADQKRVATARAEHDALQEMRQVLQTLDKRLKQLLGSN
jgi:predicted  nucleic acid-binding Zn ribbon protein